MIGRLVIAAAVALAVFGATLGMTGQAEAAANCRNRDDIVQTLSKRYKESRRAYGLSSNMQVLELYASESGTWTAVVTTPDGKSCIVASGEAWTEQEAIQAGQPASFSY